MTPVAFVKARLHWLLPWLLLVAAGVAAALRQQQDVLNLSSLGHSLFPADPDNWMRLAQARRWITGGDFFDHAVPGTNAPFGGITSHWTRPVDALLAGLAAVMPGDIDRRLLLAATWLPVLLGFAGMGVLVATARRMLPHRHALWVLMSLAVTNIVTTNYFSPGYADHHGPLCVLWCGVLFFLTGPPSRRRGLGIGVLLGVMLWISVEALLLIAPVYALMGLFGLSSALQMRAFSVAALAAALTACLGLMVEVPPGKILSVVTYDSLSIVYAVLMSLCAAGVVFLDIAFMRIQGLRPRLTVAGGVAAAILAVLYAAFPTIFRGALADADPFIFSDFLPGIVEARSLRITFQEFPALFIIDVFQVALAALLVFATWRANLWRRKARAMTVLCLLLAWTFALTAMQVRWNYYMQPVAMVLIAALLPLWSVSARTKGFGWLRAAFPAYARPYVIIYILSAAAAAPMYFMHTEPQDSMYCEAYMQQDVSTGQVRRALGENPLTLLTTPHMGGPVQFFTPYSVVAGNYHREGAGLRDLHALLNAPDFAAVKPLLEKRRIDAVLLCPDAAEGWIGQLKDTANLPPWITPVPAEKPAFPRKVNPAIFRINTSSAGKASIRPSLEGSCGQGCEPPAAR